MKAIKKDLLPIREVAGDLIISKNADITVGYEIGWPEIFTGSVQQHAEIHQSLVRAIEQLSPSTIVHVQNRFIRDQFFNDEQPKEGPHPERRLLHHHSYVFITRLPVPRKLPGHATSTLNKPHLVPRSALDPQTIRRFEEEAGRFEELLRSCEHLTIRKLKGPEITGDTSRPGLIEQYLMALSPDQPPTLNDIQFKPEFRIGQARCAIYSLADAAHLPDRCSASIAYRPYSHEGIPFPLSFSSPIGLLLDCNHVCNLFIYIQPQEETVQRLETKRRRHHSLSAHSRNNTLVAKAVDDFLNEASADQRVFIKMHAHILIWADQNPNECHSRTVAALTTMGATPHLELESAAKLFWAGIPGNAGELPINETFDTFPQQAACFMITETSDHSSYNPAGVRLHERLYGRPIYLDLNDAPMRSGLIHNRNKLVAGGSGSGKSFLMNHLLHSYYLQGAHSVIVDIGGSYKNLVGYLEGYEFVYTEDSPIRFNPFYLPPGARLDTEKKESIKTLLLAIWKKDDETTVRSEYVAISQALQSYYQYLEDHSDIFPCFNSFYEFIEGDYRNSLSPDQLREKDFDYRSFLYVLRPYYCGGEFDYLLNATEQLDLLDQQLIVFELDNIKDHPILFPIVTLIIMEVFISKMRKLPGIRKTIVIEEAWKAIARTGMSEYIRYLFKTVRKFNGEAIVVTQEVEDLVSSSVVRQAIVNNTDCKMLLDQHKFLHRFEEIGNTLGLSAHDKSLVLSLNRDNEPGKDYREVFISLGQDCSRVYRNEVTLEEHLIYTSKESEKILVADYAKRYRSIRQGIQVLAADIRKGRIALPLVFLLALLGCFLSPTPAKAQLPILSILDQAARRVIIATDLEIQRFQTRTIGLQGAQLAAEEDMQQSQLTGIAGWLQQQLDLFSEYYQELWMVKTALKDYDKVRSLFTRQAALIADYRRAYAAVRADPHFSADELAHILAIYDGILAESLENVNRLALVVRDFALQIDDAGRLQLIDETSTAIDTDANDLRTFTRDNILLSLQRARDRQDLDFVRTLYGLN